MKLSEVNILTKNIKKIGDIQKSPNVPRPNMISSDSFINSKTSLNEEKQNLFLKLSNKIKSIFTSNKSNQEPLKTDLSLDKDNFVSLNKSSSISFKGSSSKEMKEELFEYCEIFDITEAEFNKVFRLMQSNGQFGIDNVVALLDINNIGMDEFATVLEKQIQENEFENPEGKNIKEKSIFHTIQILKKYSDISTKPLFEPFNLSFDEVADIYKNLTFANVEGIIQVLRNNDNNVISQLEKDKKIQSYKANLIQIAQKLHSDVENYAAISSNDIAEIRVNGQTKKILLPNIKRVEEKNIPQELAHDILKSNLITLDVINTLEKPEYKDILEELHSSVLTSKVYIEKEKDGKKISELAKIKFNYDDLVKKINDSGFDALSSHEIHALTDKFSTLYSKDKNPKFINLVNNIVTDTNNTDLKKMYGYILRMQEMAKPVLSKYKDVKINTHAYMRMLDRNLAVVADNKTGKILDFPEYIKILAEQARKASSQTETRIEELNNGATIKMLLEPKTKDKAYVTIDSVMAQ